MDNEAKEIMRTLVTLHYVFATAFIVFIVIFSIIGIKFVRDVSAFNQCQSVADEKFTDCYKAKR